MNDKTKTEAEKKPVSQGVKESLEGLAALEIFAGAAGEVAADGRIGADDINVLFKLGKDFNVITEGIKDISKAKAELMDLDKEELVLIVSGLYDVFAAFKSAKSA